MSGQDFLEFVKHQTADYAALQRSFLGFFVLVAIEALVLRKRWLQKLPNELVTDMFYWVMMPTVRITSRILGGLVVLQVATLLGVQHGPRLVDGFGPLARQPMWLIVLELILLMDFATYWMHRTFHMVPFLWRFHALHHSAKYIRWSTTGRVHPINEMLNYLVTVVPFALLGFPVTSAVAMATPIVIVFAVGAHTQWDITFGPLSKFFVSPRFHHWHHTHSDEGGNKNFANVFSFWDRLFGTYYLPEGRSPTTFGLDADDAPDSYLGQLLYPWQGAGKRAASPSATSMSGTASDTAPAANANPDPQVSKVM